MVVGSFTSVSLSRRLASRGADKFAGVAWEPSPLGSPALAGVVAWTDCEVEQLVEIGDHVLVVGRVRGLRAASPKTPLLFFRGGYGDYFSTTSLLLDRLVGG